jgi:mannitol/fructose-specific phosphotransferase system IIA component (Ntr-type)
LLLTDLLTVDHIKIPLQSRTKDEVLRELVEIVTEKMPSAEREEVLRAVTDREARLSTGVGYGVAIPHGKLGMMSALRMAAGRVDDAIDFDALDGQPVRLLFLLVGPEAATGPHIRALSRISRMVRREDVRGRLIEAMDAAEFLRTLQDAER